MGKFQPGQSGNPSGRPKKGYTLTDILNRTLEDREIDGITGKEAIASKLISLALEGDVSALKYIYERIDGRPFQAIQIVQPRPIIYSDDPDLENYAFEGTQRPIIFDPAFADID